MKYIFIAMVIGGIWIAISEKQTQALSDEWNTCVEEQKKVEGMPYEDFMKQCMK